MCVYEADFKKPTSNFSLPPDWCVHLPLQSQALHELLFSKTRFQGIFRAHTAIILLLVGQ